MAIAMILSGGTGSRLGGDVPKQYLIVNDKPIIGYCLDIIQKCKDITKIIIIADPCWNKFIYEYIINHNISKFYGFANNGRSRQHSIFNGLKKLNEMGICDETKIIIHDSVRPHLTNELIIKCLETLEEYDCSMPVIPLKDTIYYSENGKNISNLLDRDKLYAGQTPEGCHYKSYFEINKGLTDKELECVKGTSSIAFDKGLSVGLFKGSELNYKITTKEDLFRFKLDVEN